MSFRNGGTYPPHTTGQFNMCNCTPPGGPAQPIRQPSPESDKDAHEHRTGPGPAHKKIALDPAESSAIYDAPCGAADNVLFGLGVGPVGAGPASLGARGSGVVASLGNDRFARY